MTWQTVSRRDSSHTALIVFQLFTKGTDIQICTSIHHERLLVTSQLMWHTLATGPLCILRCAKGA